MKEKLMYNYTVTLTNFGTELYNGSDLATALGKAEKCGFEATVTITYDDEIHGLGVSYRTYSPISGWKRG
jgi:hypothetical protein